VRTTLSPTQDLAEVADRIRAGDPAAEEELVREFGDRVRVFVIMRTRDHEAARDLGQEIMLSVLTALRAGRLRDSERLVPFVYGTARNLVNNYLRARRDERTGGLPADVAATTADPGAEFETGQRRGLVRRALARLSRSDRGILLLTLVDGLKPGEIGDRLGLTGEVVRARKTRALRRVIERIEELSRKRS
jgi:RNA polymerase sigma factor (sigma-70 family)